MKDDTYRPEETEQRPRALLKGAFAGTQRR
jgi:hypothetical protein